MKYIKLFEDLNNYEETNDFIYEYLDFDNKEILELGKLGFEPIWAGDDKNKCLVNDDICLYKFPDEWYYLTDGFSDKSYKCDQFDSLLSCLKDKFGLEGEYNIRLHSVDESKEEMKYIKIFETFNLMSHLKDRGVDPNKTRVIVDEESNDVFFFLYNLSGQVVGYQKYNPKYQKKGQRKSADPRMVKYYNWVSDEHKNKMIAVWGLESYKVTDKYLFITEGVFDIARAHEVGYPGIAVLCNDPNPQLGYWLKTLPQKKIVIYDNDKAGEELKKLGDYAFSVSEGKDLNDLTPSEAKKFLDNIILKIENKI